jgi:zinc finger protein 830
MRLQRIRDGTLGRPPGAPAPERQQSEDDEAGPEEPPETSNGDTNGVAGGKTNKRKADEDEEHTRKKSKVEALPEGFFDEGIQQDTEPVAFPTISTPPVAGQEFHLPSRPATPLKTPETVVPPKLTVDEDEWAAFEADIAAAEAPTAEDAVISAPAMSAADLAAKSREDESAQRKERQEAELEGDKEDAARKLEEEFEEMEALEERLRKLKEKREALRLKDTAANSTAAPVSLEAQPTESKAPEINGAEEEDKDDEDDDDDDWDGFRLKS